MNFSNWLGSLVSLFFVVAFIEHLLPSKKGPLKQIVSLLILLGVLAPFFSSSSFFNSLPFFMPKTENLEEASEEIYKNQMESLSALQVETLVKQQCLEEIGKEPKKVAVGLGENLQGEFLIESLEIEWENKEISLEEGENLEEILKENWACLQVEMKGGEP